MEFMIRKKIEKNFQKQKFLMEMIFRRDISLVSSLIVTFFCRKKVKFVNSHLIKHVRCVEGPHNQIRNGKKFTPNKISHLRPNFL